MPLTFRPAQPEDFPQCFDLLPERFLFNTAKSRAELLAFWGKIFNGGLAMSSVVEDHERPKGKNIVGFGLCVFVTDDFAREARTTLPPFLPLQVLQRFKKTGKHGPFLDRKAVAHHNARGGLNLLTLHYGVDRRETIEEEIPVRSKLLESFMALCGGFQMRQFLHEVYGASEKDMMMHSGSQVRRDYAEFLDRSPLVRAHRPFLTGVDRDEGLKKPLIASPFFLFSPPLFGFSQGEQDVLKKALWVEIDKDIAPALGLTVWAIKKRWQGIYAKVEKVDPAILGPMKKKNEEEHQKTRRRFLLDYLRTHLEELRPYNLGPQRKKKTAGKR
ncbi:MAG TPA: hypothetical protein VK859_07390 [bacterium]|jgi:hypothetical protein|nr:hypothetical protein [bacterium]